MKILIIVILVLAIAILAPILFMWCMETLFAIHIDLTFKTWLAAFLLLCLFTPSSSKKK